jgi:glutamyl-tRNA reductase
MEQADIVVASTSSPHHVIECEELAEVMRARGGRPLLLIDLAVPRDIHPDCRDVDGVSLHDMDDLQTLVERNASGREAEARRAESVLRGELLRFERWLGAQDVVPTVGALRERADEIVERVLAENEPRWESLTETDRERMRAMARAIASRLLHEPTLRLKRSSGDEDAYVYVNTLRELFGLDSDSAPARGADAEIRPLRDARRGRSSR